MDLFPSACIWAEPGPVDRMLESVKQTAFHFVDVEPATLDAPGALDTLKRLGLKVSCVALDHELPAECSWERDGEGAVRMTRALESAIVKAESLGATTGYIAPCKQRKQLARFRDAAAQLAQFAAGHNVKLCVEHAPGRALSGARETLAWVEGIGQPNLYLLLDVGHTLITREKAWEIAEAAGARLGYVQLDDNDGKKDLHWPLLDGVLRREELLRTLETLKRIGYQGTLGLELVPYHHVSLISSLSKNHNLVLRLQHTVAGETGA
jgi:sugar phosphate isomerase/epimerase